jgi:hypothetical protein
MALVAVSMVAIISMAALSIDLGTLYEAKTEAQRAADAGALAAARVISVSGITGDPTNGGTDGSWAPICGGGTSAATLAATNVAQQNLIGGAVASTVNVYYGTSGGVATDMDCAIAGTGFGVNPVVQVYVQQKTLPTFFARVFSLLPGGTSSNSGVSATATAQAFNSSNSAAFASEMMPVQPRCVKPWIVPNSDPGNGGAYFVVPATGNINHQGVYESNGGVIGETFNLSADCIPGATDCLPAAGHAYNNPPQWNSANQPGILQYVPALVQGVSSAIPSCSTANPFPQAIAGCDQSTVYACGTPNGATINFNENPMSPAIFTGDTNTAVACLTQASPTYSGADTLAPATFPFQIQAGLGNPLVQAGVVKDNGVISTSNSIVTVPIYDSSPVALVGVQPPVTILGFLQVFINQLNPNGSMSVTVMNVSGCSNNAAGNPTVSGTSPVPIRLITQP